MLKTTKGGKTMNPTDAYRKEIRKKELKRNKRLRKKVREVGILKKDPDTLKDQIQMLESMMGLATTLALLGVAASFAGKAYGQVRQGLPLGALFLAVVMGLNLLEVVELQIPSFFNNFDPRAADANFPSSVQAYLAGLTFALSCSQRARVRKSTRKACHDSVPRAK